MTELERRRDVARSIADDLAGRDGVQAVLLVGSTATGHADEHSDVDLQVVGPDEAGERSVDGIHVEWNPVTREEIAAKLDGWDNDAELYTYANADLLSDRAGLADLLAQYDEYPQNVRREKLYAGWFYGTGSAFDARKAVERGHSRAARCVAASAVEQFAALAYVLEGRFPPYSKWLFRDLPRELPGIDAALSGEVETLDTMQEALEGELREQLDDERVEKPYLFQPAFDPLG